MRLLILKQLNGDSVSYLLRSWTNFNFEINWS